MYVAQRLARICAELCDVADEETEGDDVAKACQLALLRSRSRGRGAADGWDEMEMREMNTQEFQGWHEVGLGGSKRREISLCCFFGGQARSFSSC